MTLPPVLKSLLTEADYTIAQDNTEDDPEGRCFVDSADYYSDNTVLVLEKGNSRFLVEVIGEVKWSHPRTGEVFRSRPPRAEGLKPEDVEFDENNWFEVCVANDPDGLSHQVIHDLRQLPDVLDHLTDRISDPEART